MRTFQQGPRPSNPTIPDHDTIQLRYNLINEELTELWEAMHNHDLEAVAKEASDLLYTVYGVGVDFGFNLDNCFDAVHESNMTKLDPDGKPIFRADGKILKGPNYSPPDIQEVLWPAH